MRHPSRRHRPPCCYPQISATRAVKPPKIDGRLDDPAWPTAPVSESFTQHYPDEGAPPTERTFVRVLYDDRNLYVGVDCWQTHSPIVRRLQRRDGSLPSDGVWIDIDSRDDGVSAYHFSINTAGALLDGIHFNDTDFSADWDAIWEAKVADTGHGYSVEFRIPLTSLRFTRAPGPVMGLPGPARHRRPARDRRLGVLPARRRRRRALLRPAQRPGGPAAAAPVRGDALRAGQAGAPGGRRAERAVARLVRGRLGRAWTRWRT